MSFYLKHREWCNDIGLATAYFVLGGVWSEELPKIAIEALVQGYDSRSLRILAGESPSAYGPVSSLEVRTLFEKSIRELDIPLPNKETAMRRIAHYRARQIVSEELDPSTGASLIWEELGQDQASGLECIDHIIAEAVRLEDVLDNGWIRAPDKREIRAETEKRIADLAQRILDEVTE